MVNHVLCMLLDIVEARSVKVRNAHTCTAQGAQELPGKKELYRESVPFVTSDDQQCELHPRWTGSVFVVGYVRFKI